MVCPLRDAVLVTCQIIPAGVTTRTHTRRPTPHCNMMPAIKLWAVALWCLAATAAAQIDSAACSLPDPEGALRRFAGILKFQTTCAYVAALGVTTSLALMCIDPPTPPPTTPSTWDAGRRGTRPTTPTTRPSSRSSTPGWRRITPPCTASSKWSGCGRSGGARSPAGRMPCLPPTSMMHCLRPPAHVVDWAHARPATHQLHYDAGFASVGARVRRWAWTG